MATRGELGFSLLRQSPGKEYESAISARCPWFIRYRRQGEYGLFITLGGYTKQARDFAATKNNLRLVDESGLVEMILRHYEQFAPAIKG